MIAAPRVPMMLVKLDDAGESLERKRVISWKEIGGQLVPMVIHGFRVVAATEVIPEGEADQWELEEATRYVQNSGTVIYN